MPVLPKSTRQVTTISGAVPNPKIGEGFNQAGYRALGNIGRVGENIADVLYKRNQEIIADRNDALAQEGLNNFKRELAAQNAKYTAERVGKSAFGLGKESEEWVDKLVNNYMLKFKSPQAYALFKERAQSASEQFIQSAYNIEKGEDKKYRQGVSEQSLQTYTEEVSGSPGLFDLNLKKAYAEIDKRQGGDVIRKENITKDLQTAVAQNLIDKNNQVDLIASQLRWDAFKTRIQDKEFVRTWDKKFEAKMNALRKDAIEKDDLAEKAAQDFFEKREHETNVSIIEAYYNGTLTNDMLDKNKLIVSQSIYDKYKGKLNKKTEISDYDAVVLGNLKTAVGYGRDVRDEVLSALTNKQITEKQYLQLIGDMADQDRREGIKYLDQFDRLKFFDKFNPKADKNRAELWDDWEAYIEGGDKPQQAAYKATIAFLDKLKAQRAGVDVPNNLSGSIDDVASLEEARRITIKQYENGKIDEDTLKDEMNKIDILVNLLSDIGTVKTLTDAQKRRINTD